MISGVLKEDALSSIRISDDLTSVCFLPPTKIGSLTAL